MITQKQLDNLEKGKFKTSEAGKEAGKKGGLSSGRRRKELKDIRLWAEKNLFRKVNNKTPLYEMLFKKLEHLSSQGNLKAIEMLLNYSGLKPIDKIAEVNTKGEDIKLLDIDKLKELRDILLND